MLVTISWVRGSDLLVNFSLSAGKNIVGPGYKLYICLGGGTGCPVRGLN